MVRDKDIVVPGISVIVPGKLGICSYYKSILYLF
jgi:hypothetical protein